MLCDIMLSLQPKVSTGGGKSKDACKKHFKELGAK